MMSPKERPASRNDNFRQKMACCSIGWTNIIVVYELEEGVKWKANSCNRALIATFPQWCRKFAVGHEITTEVCKFLYEAI